MITGDIIEYMSYQLAIHVGVEKVYDIGMWSLMSYSVAHKCCPAVRYCDPFVSVHQLPCVCEEDVENFFMSTVVLSLQMEVCRQHDANISPNNLSYS